MIKADGAEILKEAHDASVRVADVENFSGVKTDHNDTHGQYLDGLRFQARAAIFGRSRVISGEGVVEGAEALFYAVGQGADTAKTSAERLAPVVEANEQTGTPQAVMSRMWNVSNVGVLAPDIYRGGVFLRTKSLSTEPSIFNRTLADLVMPYADGSAFRSRGDGAWHDSTSADGYVPDISIEGLARRAEGPAIFDDPEEASAFSDQERHANFVLVGSEAVLSMLGEEDGQGAAAVKNILKAIVEGEERPSVENIDLVAATAAGIKALIGPHAVPAEAHPSILSQMSKPELMAASHAAVGEMSSEEFAKSQRLSGLRFNRKLEASIDRIAGGVAVDFLDHAGVTQDEIGEEERLRLESHLIRGYALSLDEHMPDNRHYKYTLTPLSRHMQRRHVARVMRAHQTD